MLNELESNRLEVILVPSKRPTNEGAMIRCVAGRNAKWYRAFCAANVSTRGVRRGKFDTCIKRFRTTDALEKMLRGDRSTYYHEQLMKIAAGYK